jgi:AcrR family transcriptional regulator
MTRRARRFAPCVVIRRARRSAPGAELEDDPLAEPPQADHPPARGRLEGGIDTAQPRRADHADALEPSLQDTISEGVQVQLDVGQLRHGAMLPAMADRRERATVGRERPSVRPAAGSGERPERPVRLLDQSGRPLGPRAVATRRKLLDATHALLDERRVREVSVVEIARRAGTSPATFYQYFKDVEEATLQLALEAAEEVPGVFEPLLAEWQGTEGLDAARALVDAFVRHWDANHAVLLFRNVAAEQGDRRFRKARIRAIHPLIEALAGKVAEARRTGAVSPSLHPQATAAALASILERLAAYHQELESLGVGRAELVETCARILHQTVTGRPTP